MKKIFIILTTFSSKKEAEKIAKILIEENLALCVQTSSKISSFYMWEKKLCCDNEYLLSAKSYAKNKSKLAKRIKELHSYKIPQLLAIESECLNEEYYDFKNWL